MRRRGMARDFFQAMKQQLNKENKDETDMPDFIHVGLYYDQLKAYNKNFPFIKIILFDEFKQDIKRIIKELFNFLPIQNKDIIPENANIKYNVSGEPKNGLSQFIYNFWIGESFFKAFLKKTIPYDLRQKIISHVTGRILQKEEMPKKVKEYLANIYQDDINKLETFFNGPEKQKIIKSWIT